MRVLKFGGTSLGTPERMQAVGALVAGDEPVIVVLSAVSGTTNQLVAIGQHLYNQQPEQALEAIAALAKHYQAYCDGLFATPTFRKQAEEMVTAHLNHIGSFTKDLFTIYEERAILAQGELISTALFHYWHQEQERDSVLLPALDFMRIDKDGEPDDWYIARNLKQQMEAHPNQRLFITQGYICRNAFGEIDNLKRGGSDYTASLIGAALGAKEIQIWTDIDGLHNNDPRVVDNTYPIERLSFEEAAELAYFGAKILHPSSILPAKRSDIPVRLKNTMVPEAHGTLITSARGNGEFKAVACKNHITAIKIQSGRMLLAYGFLRKVFEVFERYKTPIDMITTSEVAVSVTIDDAGHLDALVEELGEFGRVEVDKDMSIVCLVGDFIGDHTGYASRVFSALDQVPLRMISFGGSRNNISFLVHEKDKRAALEALNQGLFLTKAKP